MAAKASRESIQGGEVAIKPGLAVLLLYEDLRTALRAKHSLDLLPLQLGADAALGTRLWRLDLLGKSMLAEQAAIEAAAADVIILSLHGRTALRPAARDWLNRWLDHKEDRPYALAVLLDPEPAHPGGDDPVVAYLTRFAQAAHADLFCGFCSAPVLWPSSRAGKIMGRASNFEAVPAEAPTRAEPRL
jgi:hypothetical protein